jgi:hypothetical protein
MSNLLLCQWRVFDTNIQIMETFGRGFDKVSAKVLECNFCNIVVGTKGVILGKILCPNVLEQTL